MRAIHTFNQQRLGQLGAASGPAADAAAATALPAGGSGAWAPIGPAPIPTTPPTSGRVTAVVVKPTNSNIAYVGTAQGGVWRTTDGGAHWTPIFDQAASLAIGALALDPASPTTLWVGTGEGNGSLDSFSGVGIYRVINAETTATLQGPFESRVAGTGTTAGNGHAFQFESITRIAIDPNNDNRMFIGTTFGYSGRSGDFQSLPSTAITGLYFTDTAKATTPTFSQVSGMTFSGVSYPVVSDVVFEPGSSSNLLVALQDYYGPGNSGVYRSTNANTAAVAGNVSPSFTRTLTSSGAPSATLAIDKVASTVTVLVSRDISGGYVVVSADGGQTWPTHLAAADGFCGGQCWYDMPIALDPKSASHIFIGGAGTHPVERSTDGGTTFTDVSFNSASSTLHADSHTIVFAPSNSSVVYTGDDGGIYRSTNALTATSSAVVWNSLNTAGFSATQFESLAIHPTDVNFTIGGTQDNGTELFNQVQSWSHADFGDGGNSALDQNATDTSTVTMYHTYFNQTNNLLGYARVDTTASATPGSWGFYGCGGIANGISCSDSVLFYAPLVLGPGNPNTVYYGSDRLYRSANKGVTAVAVSQAPIQSGVAISAIGVSNQSDNVRIVGLENGEVWYTNTGSSTLTHVTPPWAVEYVSRTVIDPTTSTTAYVTLDGYLGGTGSSQSHVWKTTNLTSAPPTWTAINSGLPDVPVNAFAVDPANNQDLFAGTDIGVYASSDGGATWAPFGTGLPIVAVFDMAISQPGTPNATLRIATHGRGLWQIPIDAPACTITGTAGNDTLTGTSGNDVICGLGGNDVIKGLGGNDTLKGGDGNDTLYPGTGNDGVQGGAGTDTVSYSDVAAGVTVNLSLAGAQNTVGAGTDTVTTVENAIGTSLNDTLTGSTGVNVLYGKGGDDTLAGGDGNDTLLPGAGNDAVDGGAGTDTVSYFDVATGVTVNLSLAGAQNTVGAGADTISTIENALGTNAADTLTGTTGVNSLYGKGGSDTLAGSDGNDVLYPGAGDDTVNGGVGLDTVSYSDLTAGVSVNLTVSSTGGAAGTDALSLIERATGTNYVDSLTGDAGVNILNGLGGNDSISGLDANDTLDGGLGTDSLDGGNGTDTCRNGETNLNCEL